MLRKKFELMTKQNYWNTMKKNLDFSLFFKKKVLIWQLSVCHDMNAFSKPKEAIFEILLLIKNSHHLPITKFPLWSLRNFPSKSCKGKSIYIHFWRKRSFVYSYCTFCKGIWHWFEDKNHVLREPISEVAFPSHINNSFQLFH